MTFWTSSVRSLTAVLVAGFAGLTAAEARPIVLDAERGLTIQKMAGDSAGGFVIVGEELVPYAGGVAPRLHVYGFTSSGRQRWTHEIRRVGALLVKTIAFDGVGKTYISGLDGSDVANYGYQSMLEIISPGGNLEAENLFGDPFPAEVFVTSLLPLPGGDLLAAIRAKEDPETDADLVVAQITARGERLWQYRLTKAAHESFPVMAESAGGIAVAGTFEDRRVFLYRVDMATQSLVEITTFAIPKRGLVQQMLALPDGGFLLAINMNGGDNDARVVRVSATGEVGLVTDIPGNSSIAAMALTPKGLAVAGTTDDPGTFATGAWVRIIGEDGEVIGEIRPDTTEETRAGGLASTGDAGLFFAYTVLNRAIPAVPTTVQIERIRID